MSPDIALGARALPQQASLLRVADPCIHHFASFFFPLEVLHRACVASPSQPIPVSAPPRPRLPPRPPPSVLGKVFDFSSGMCRRAVGGTAESFIKEATFSVCSRAASFGWVLRVDVSQMVDRFGTFRATDAPDA